MTTFYRRALTTFCACFFILSAGLAQKFTIGAKAGPLVSWANFGDKDDKEQFTHKPVFGYYGAGIVVFPLKNNYSLQTEFGFSQQGRKIAFNEDTWVNKATYYFLDGSMALRRSFKIHFGPNIPAEWFVDVGPRINYWLGGHGTVDAGGTYDYTIIFDKMPDEPVSPDFNKMYIVDENRWLFGIDVGVGFKAPLKNNSSLLTELRFTSGHTYFGTPYSASNRTLGFTDDLRSNQKTISLTVAYLLDIDLRQRRTGKSTKDKEVSTHRRK
ncbi:MAG: porin family protein [Chryseolinea sp.]